MPCRKDEFGRYAEERAKRQGKKKPGTFDFLGLTHICARSSAGASQRSANGANNTDICRWTKQKTLNAKLRGQYYGPTDKLSEPSVSE
jgi:RNA-directed DNA polymerase